MLTYMGSGVVIGLSVNVAIGLEVVAIVIFDDPGKLLCCLLASIQT